MKKPVEEMTDMERFSVFLWYADNPDYREIVNRVIESKEGLAVAGEVLMSISKDEREKAIFRNRRIALADLESNMVTMKRIGRQEGIEEGLAKGLAKGRVEGLAKGLAKGREEGLLSVAKGLLADGDSIDRIVKVTGLTREAVENLRDAG